MNSEVIPRTGCLRLSVCVKLQRSTIIHGGRLYQPYDLSGGTEPESEPELNLFDCETGLERAVVHATLCVWVQAMTRYALIEDLVRTLCAEIVQDGQIKNALPPSWIGAGIITSDARIVRVEQVPGGVTPPLGQPPHRCRYRRHTLKAELCSALMKGASMGGAHRQCCCCGVELYA